MSELVELQAIYAGVRLTGAGKRYVVIRSLDNESYSSFDVEKAKDWKPFNGLVPGSVISFKGRPAEDDDRAVQALVFSSVRYVKKWDNDGDRLRWATESEIASADWQRRRLGRNDTDALHEALDPIRSIYQSAVGWKRTALLAEIVRYLVS